MATVLVTIDGPQQSIDCEVPGDIPIGDLLPLLLDACGIAEKSPSLVSPATWALGLPSGQPLRENQSLIACGVVDGMRLLLRDKVSWDAAISEITEEVAPDLPPSSTTGGIGVHWNRDGWH